MSFELIDFYIYSLELKPKEELSCSLTEMFPIWSCLQEERLF